MSLIGYRLYHTQDAQVFSLPWDKTMLKLYYIPIIYC
jgi:hypothetical protein